MKTSHRSERLADEIRMYLGQIVSRMGDPRIGLATVTEVHLSPDLRHARVMISVLGEEAEQQKSIQALDAARAYLRHELARALNMRFTPELHFTLDQGFEQVARVEELLKRARRKKGTA